jgi:hypothetical protein
MAIPKWLRRDETSGVIAETAAIETTSGAGDADKLVATGADGKIDPTFLPAGDNAVFVAGETIADGAFVYIKASDSKAYNASGASGGNPAMGFVLAGYSALDDAVVYFSGENTHRTGLTVQSRYYLSTATPGSVQSTVPSGTGSLAQLLGEASATTVIPYDGNNDYILLA